jgi:hypothetical protein
MHKLSFILIFSLVSFFTSAQNTDTIRIDPDNPLGGKLSEIFDSVEYIPLETTKESLFGHIDKLIITDDYFFILDNSTDQILIFTKAGKFYSKISMHHFIKTNYMDWNGIRTFAVSAQNRTIVVLHGTEQGSLYIFNFEGKLQRIIKDKHWASFACIDKDHYFMVAGGDITDNLTNQSGNCIITDKNISVFYHYLFNTIISAKMNYPDEVTTVPNSNTVFYTRAYDNNAYQIDSNGITRLYHFIFPLSYTLPPDLLKPSFIEKRVEYIQHINPKAIFQLVNFCKLKGYFSFSFYSKQSLLESFIYSLSSQNLYSMFYIVPDSSNNFLPLSFDGKFSGTDADYFYENIPAYQFISSYQDNSKKNIVYSEKNRKIFASLNRLSNPLIIRLKPKKNL